MLDYQEIEQEAEEVAFRLSERFVGWVRAVQRSPLRGKPGSLQSSLRIEEEIDALYDKHREELVDGETRLDFDEAVKDLIYKALDEPMGEFIQ